MFGCQKSALVTLALAFVLCWACVEAGALRKFAREAKDPNATTEEPNFCHRSTPCGWSVYTPFTRDIEYYMPNTCECREGLDCIRTENDVSISAFVHMCREKPIMMDKTL